MLFNINTSIISERKYKCSLNQIMELVMFLKWPTKEQITEFNGSIYFCMVEQYEVFTCPKAFMAWSLWLSPQGSGIGNHIYIKMVMIQCNKTKLIRSGFLTELRLATSCGERKENMSEIIDKQKKSSHQNSLPLGTGQPKINTLLFIKLAHPKIVPNL